MRYKFKGKKIYSVHTSAHDICIYENFRKRWMTFDTDYIQTAIYKKRPWQPLLYYIQPLTCGLVAIPNLTRGLILGMGGGALIHTVQHDYPQLQLTAIEINPTIITLAQQYFQVAPSSALRIVNAAAENYVSTVTERFDAIFIDLYQAQSYPEACATPEFFSHIKKLLNGTGLVSLNLVYHNAVEFRKFLALITTSLSKQTLCMPVVKASNMVIHAYQGEGFLGFLQTLAQRQLITRLQWDAEFGMMAE